MESFIAANGLENESGPLKSALVNYT